MAARIILANAKNANANLTNANFLLISLSYLGIDLACEVPGWTTVNRKWRPDDAVEIAIPMRFRHVPIDEQHPNHSFAELERYRMYFDSRRRPRAVVHRLFRSVSAEEPSVPFPPAR